MIPDLDDFECEYCGKDFGSEPQKLAVHIGKIHDSGRGKN